MVSLALFSFSHDETYHVQSYSCQNNQIQIQYEENWYDFSLFNIIIKEGNDICPYLEGEVEIEFENLAKVEEPFSGYLFVNGELLQKTLIEVGAADVKINNPNYQYELQSKKAQVISDKVESKKKTYSMQSRNIAIVLIVLWFMLCLYLIVRKRKSHVQKDTKSEENVV